MTVPAFVDVEPAIDCDCAGCIHERRAMLRATAVQHGGHPGARGLRRAVLLVAAAGAVLSGGAGAAVVACHPFGSSPGSGPGSGPGSVSASGKSVLMKTAVTSANGPSAVASGTGKAAAREAAPPSPGTPQGAAGGLFGGAGSGRSVTPAADRPRPASRAEIISRAQQWVDQRVPYRARGYWSDGYRQDCSGFVSMAWGLGSNQWTGSLAQFGIPIYRKEDLLPGDMLLFHNPRNPASGSHVTLFGGWADSERTQYIAYEQTWPHTVKHSTPYAYWNNSGRYVAYRYNHLVGAEKADGFPGADAFGFGADNRHVTRLREMLVRRGGATFYTSGPGPRWSDEDRRATEAFQEAQGWTGRDADGIPGPTTWDYLVNGKGKDIGGGSTSGGASSTASTAFPGSQYFRPGQSNAYVTQLGRQLVKKGFGTHYTSGPGPTWSEPDRRNVEAFQRAQGWRDSSADGYPGPETWRRLFR
ncbi:peptidoglycan-binding protein [Streptomyces sp. H27-D2]|uniref:peptidoglycan-binding protein n=1 Tax=Streptomyces sp. H27-D2 TaxID=3046304 RepID=UPI002DB8F807|nr:peptidoglycan-binding protein [Streptomyces sp. H27-D2]MEC4015185.1 peptidoglycan-binding protein [Streptomyces sp. H27-D2]